MSESKERFSDFLATLPKRTIGVVYSFQPPETSQERWYDRWHSDVISTYGRAVEQLGAEPYYIDVASFCEKGFSGRLPPLDCIFNLNAGIQPISNWALVPSVAEWLGVKVLPCGADIAVLSERKDLSYLVAGTDLFQRPLTTDSRALRDDLSDLADIVRKPRDLGGSVGISRRKPSDARQESDILLQEFIPGYDITVPVVWNPLTEQLTALPGILYVPESSEPTQWFHSEQTKRSGLGYRKQVVHLTPGASHRVVECCQRFQIQTYARLDLRIRGQGVATPDAVAELDDVFFIEMNAMPTIRLGINFLDALADLPQTHDFLPVLNEVTAQGVRPEFSGACAIMASALCSVLSD